MELTPHEKEKIERLRRAMYSRTASEHLGERERRALRPIPSKIGEEWVRDEGEVPKTIVAPRSIDAPRKALKWLFIGAGAFFLVAVGAFAYYFTLGGGGSAAARENIGIEIRGPSQVNGGEPTELQIVVTNKNQLGLELADLVITHPPGTRSPSDLATDLPAQRIPLGAIEPGGRRQGTVSAVFAGPEGTRQNVRVELEYRLAGSSAIFVADSQYQFTLASSPISVTVEANDEAVSGQELILTATVSSNADSIIKDVLLKVENPFGFKYVSSDLAPLKNGVWVIGDLRPGEKKIVKIRGVLEGQMNDERVFRITGGFRSNRSADDVQVPLVELSHRIGISDAFLALSVSVNRETGGDTATALPGETQNVVVSWENTLGTPITDVVIVAKLEGTPIAGETVKSNDGFYRSADRAVLWDKNTTRGLLTSLAPGTRGSVGFSMQIPTTEGLGNTRNPQVVVSIQAAGKRMGETGVPETLQSTAVRTVKVSSDVQIKADGLYYANPFGSRGPIPPQAGEETTYALVFTLRNSTNQISNAKLKAVLPPYVRWVGIYSPSSERMEFRSSDSAVEWNIGTIAVGTGAASSTPRQVAFAVALTPSTSQIGQDPELLQSIVLTGTDAHTGKAVSKTVPAVSADLRTSDPGFPANGGTVVP